MGKQKKLYQVLTFLLVIVLSFGGTSWAHNLEDLKETISKDLDYMDDIRKYDVPYLEGADTPSSGEAQEKDEPAEVLKYAKADNIMVAIGLFSFDSYGLYNEHSILNYKEYMKIMTKLRYGKDAEPENYGIDLTVEKNITHQMAVREIMEVLGYALPIDDDGFIFKMINKIELLKNIEYRAEKYITRGEFSQLVYNALGIDLMELYSTGAKNQYVVTEGKNLLDVVFNMTEISGLCTAACGIDIYSNAYLETDEIAIDAHRFTTNGQDTSGFLGKRVYSLLEKGSEVDKLVFIGVDENDTSVTVANSDLYFKGGALCYKDKEAEKKISYAAINTYVYNGESVMNNNFSSDLLDRDGSITFASSQKNGKYDIAIINVYENLVVDFVSKNPSVRIYFKYGANFAGENYIDLEEADSRRKKTILITKDGKSVTASEIVPDDVVSILKSQDGSYIHVSVSSEKKNGTIETIEDGNILTIDNKEYTLSKSYMNLMKSNSELLEPEPGMSVSLKLSTHGYIADVQLAGNENKYAILKQIDVLGRNNIELMVFAETGFWEFLKLAEKMTVDGETKLSTREAYEILIAEEEKICYKPIRYKLNEDGEVIFLDTVLNNREEKDDPDAVAQSSVWPGVGQVAKTDWTKGTNLKGSTYSIAEDAVIFKLPDNLEDEDQYIRYRRSQLPVEALSNFVIYNADDFFRGKLIIYTAPSSSSSSFESSLNIMISKIGLGVNEDDEVVYKIIGYSSNKITGATLMEIYTTAEIKEERSDLVPGAVISYRTDADGYVNSIGQFVTPEQAVDPANDRITFEDYNEALGTVLAVDVKGRSVKLRIGEERFDKTNEYAVEEQGGCLFDSATGEVTPITAADIRPGDRVFIRGLYRKNSIFIYR